MTDCLPEKIMLPGGGINFRGETIHHITLLQG
jgi:hypothetical protein